MEFIKQKNSTFNVTKLSFKLLINNLTKPKH